MLLYAWRRAAVRAAGTAAAAARKMDDANADGSHGDGGKLAKLPTLPADIEALHVGALSRGEDTYADPKTGFQVFTALAHNTRGFCCGSRCRHCPYGHTNVGRPDRIKKDRADAKKRKAQGQPAKASVYTRGGDKGTSALFTGERRPKDELVFEAMGTVDELNSVIGVAMEYCDGNGLLEHLQRVQGKLMDVGSYIATPRETATRERLVYTAFEEEEVDAVEALIDALNSEIPRCTAFVLPTGGKCASHLHLARTVCRRGERVLVRLNRELPQGPVVMKYLNRLSDLLFVMARYAAHKDGRDDVWRPDRGLPKPPGCLPRPAAAAQPESSSAP
eukprot:TRINITY_DN2937_c0_g3_i1.p2 TRINITY_DN2937_c0_g3~~TRINITY_DN2937_c0_g3_i1.p2  ORF type:complete len:369 (+),score=134.16 TRINITY_DN2937_c0_g3_i1:109-1107(+)